MKRVCIVSTADLSRMTMLSIYTKYFIENHIEYDIICGKKDGKNEDPNAHAIYEFDARPTDKSSKAAKLLHFWSMRKMVRKIWDDNTYDFVVVWNQVTSFLLADILKKRFKGKYCINIRDYQLDDKPIIKQRLAYATKHAAFNTISSEAYKQFLPKGEYLTIHSLNTTMLSGIEKHDGKRLPGQPIRILNIGQIRWLDNIYPLIDELGNDNRYEMYFIGVGSEKLKEYIEEHNIKNVTLHGRFQPDETPDFLKNADVIFNLYGVGRLHVDTALSIKLYYAVYLGVPILTYKGTYMNEVATRLGIGYSVTKDELSGMKDDFYSWYQDFDEILARQKCDEYISEALNSHDTLYRKMDSYLNN